MVYSLMRPVDPDMFRKYLQATDAGTTRMTKVVSQMRCTLVSYFPFLGFEKTDNQVHQQPGRPRQHG